MSISRPFPVAAMWLAAALFVSGPVHAQDGQTGEAEWRRLFMEGIAAYQRRDEDAAIAKWEEANRVYDGRPEGYNNIAVILEQRRDFSRAAAMYRQALAVFSRMRAPLDSERSEREATRRDIHQGLLGTADELFNQGKAAEAADALQALTAADPNNRAAWITLSLALSKLERWADLVPVARRRVELEPLSVNARTLLANVYRNQRASPDPPLEPLDKLPVFLDDVQMAVGAGRVTLRGTASGAAAAPGTPVGLEVTLYNTGNPIATKKVAITAPQKGRQEPFATTIETTGEVTGFSYRVE